MANRLYVTPTIKKNVDRYIDKHGAGASSQSSDMIEGELVEQLTQEYGSPLFVFSEEKLRQKYRDAHRAFSTRYPRVQFAWSYKTNYLKAICRVFHDEGTIAEVVSDFEYEKARNLGMPGDQIIVNGPCKSRELLKRAIFENAKIQLDNYTEIATLESIAEEMNVDVDVAIRVNLETGNEPVWSKFGFSYERGEALRAIRQISEGGRLKLVGLHMHIGTFILDPRSYSKGLTKLLTLAAESRERFGAPLQYINCGGGFASSSTLHYQYLPSKESAPSFQDYAEAICETLNEKWPSDQPLLTLYLETGRALVDDAGYLITSVLDSRCGGDGSRAIIVDAGVNLLYTAAWYKFDMQVVQPKHGAVDATTVYGPLCMNIDVLRREVPLPPMDVGDQLVIHPVGAYNVTQAMQFITYRPAVVMIGSGGEVDVIRGAENLEHVERIEQVPARLRG